MLYFHTMSYYPISRGSGRAPHLNKKQYGAKNTALLKSRLRELTGSL